MTTDSNKPQQYDFDIRKRGAYAVWEITLKCNLGCTHCGSRAGKARNDELSTDEALDLVRQMAEAGIEEVTLIGGEAYLRKDWIDIAKAITHAGMTCSMTTGGYGINRTMAERMVEAGLNHVSISIDGLEETHDKLRGREGSWQFAFESMRHLKAAGVPFSINSQLNRLSAPEFPLFYQAIQKAGAIAWQLAMTVPMGNAADNAEILLQPYELLVLHPMLIYIGERARREGVNLQPGNNVGYYGPYERRIRNLSVDDNDWAFWKGCQAGLSVLGIEADGAIKGCPSLPTGPYTGANIRDKSLYEIVTETQELTFNLKAGTDEGTDHMWGFCKSCEFAELCRGGCSWTAQVFFDRRGNNPYCHHRALFNASNDIRESVFLVRAAKGLPFDNGEFAISEGSFCEPFVEDDPLRFTADKIQWPEEWLREDPVLADFVENEIAHNIATYKKMAAEDKIRAA